MAPGLESTDQERGVVQSTEELTSDQKVAGDAVAPIEGGTVEQLRDLLDQDGVEGVHDDHHTQDNEGPLAE